MAEAKAAAGEDRQAKRFLAYEHTVAIDIDSSKMAELYAAAQKACLSAAATAQCTILEASFHTGRTPRASLKLRAKPAGIASILQTLSKQAQFKEQSTSAEDLSGPIEDLARKLAMLKDYRDKLEALRGKASNDIDALIKVNKELAQVQSSLEAKTGEHAHLMQRVDTEILNISMTSEQQQAFASPIYFALSDFSNNLAQGTSNVISAVASLLPWALLLSLCVWIGRALWRRRKR